MNEIEVGFKRTTKDATLPVRAHTTDSGFDLFASEDVIIGPGNSAVVPTGIAVQLPPGTEAQVRPKSGITSRTYLRVQLGTVDNGYTGEVGVMVDNISCDPFGPDTQYVTQLDGDMRRTAELHGDTTYQIRKGDKIAQLVVQYLPQVVTTEVFGDLDESERGSGGYGSTGSRQGYELINCGVCYEMAEVGGFYARLAGMCERCYQSHLSKGGRLHGN